ncbi:MAG: hypothetical protein NVSMB6_16830 [Burkholderiaceae bacterium]
MVLGSAQKAFGAELDLRLHATLVRAARHVDAAELTWIDGNGRAHTEEFSLVLAATERVPARRGLSCA